MTCAACAAATGRLFGTSSPGRYRFVAPPKSGRQNTEAARCCRGFLLQRCSRPRTCHRRRGAEDADHFGWLHLDLSEVSLSLAAGRVEVGVKTRVVRGATGQTCRGEERGFLSPSGTRGRSHKRLRKLELGCHAIENARQLCSPLCLPARWVDSKIG
jgi:hypothetical protein